MIANGYDSESEDQEERALFWIERAKNQLPMDSRTLALIAMANALVGVSFHIEDLTDAVRNGKTP